MTKPTGVEKSFWFGVFWSYHVSIKSEGNGNKEVEEKNKLWLAVLGEIELSVSHGNYVTWFKNSRLLQAGDGLATIGVSNIFVKNHLEQRYSDLICELLAKNGLVVSQVMFEVSGTNPTKIDEQQEVTVAASAASETTVAVKTIDKRPPAGAGTLTHRYRQGLNERYTFDNFVVGSGNELAYAACQGVAKYPGNKYNPLYLYGGVGVGKTHLIQALGNEVLAKNPEAKIVYATTEQFVQEFVDALRFKKTTDFAQHYRGADVLIVDDMQFITGKEKVQEEFFHTFNALHQANKQIVLSSDQPPNSIPTLENRLKSRFAMGMTIDMQNPDFETRCAIIKTKALLSSIELDQTTAEYLANLVKTNIRELEGILNQFLAFCEVRALTPNVDTARGFLGNGSLRPKNISPKQIIEAAAKHFQIPVSDIIGPKRDKDIVVPRQIAMYMLRNELSLSFPRIANELGRKDHTTAIHSVAKIDREAHIDPNLRSIISEIRDVLYV